MPLLPHLSTGRRLETSPKCMCEFGKIYASHAKQSEKLSSKRLFDSKVITFAFLSRFIFFIVINLENFALQKYHILFEKEYTLEK